MDAVPSLSPELAARFNANLSRFAAYKAHEATSRIRQAEDPGAARATLRRYNTYQAAEYNTAVTRARTAKQWEKFSSDNNVRLFPNIRWIPSRSANPREAHRRFWNRIWPKDDPFWNENTPGSLWNCKCDWEQTSKPATDGNPSARIAHKGLTGNPAKTGQIFTDSHPYIAKAPKVTLDEQTAARYPSLQHLIDTDTTKFRLDFYRDNGGFLETNLARIKEGNLNKQEMEKFSKEHSMCVTLATNGFNISYLESVEGRYDILLNDLPADLKKTSSANHILDYAKKAFRKQGAKAVIFEFDCEITAQIHHELNIIKEFGWLCYYFTTTDKTVIKP